MTLIINDYSKDFTALVDSGAYLNVIQEGLIPTRYFYKTTHTLSHAWGNNLQIDYKLPEAKVCINRKCIQTSFLLAKNITNQVTHGTPFLTKIHPIKRIDSKGIVGTIEKKDITLQFIIEPLTKVLHDVYNSMTIKKELNVRSIDDRLQNTFSLENRRNNPNAF